jgi:hypothetical protein
VASFGRLGWPALPQDPRLTRAAEEDKREGVQCPADTVRVNDERSFRLAYDEAIRALRAQGDAHGGLRQRAATVLATSMVVTSFFGGQAVARDAAPTSTGWLAVAAFLVAGVLSVYVLFPADLTFAPEIAGVVALIERVPQEREAYRELALQLSSQHKTNSRRLTSMQWVFRGAAIALLVEAFFWILFLSQS